MSTAEFLSRWTMIDQALANMFADDQINHLMCTDPDVIKAFCKDTGTCLHWRADPSRQMWTRPSYFSRTECKTDDDCKSNTPLQPHCRDSGDGRKLCAYDPQIPQDIASAGTCEISSQAKCEEFSKVPYACDKNGGNCDFIDGARYYEWRDTQFIKCDDRENPCPIRGSKCLTTGECSCTTDDDCVGTAKCEFSDVLTNQKVCKGGGRCVFGNHMLRLWCENPKNRCQAQPAEDAKDCKEKKDCKADEDCVSKKCVGPKDYPSDCGGKSSNLGTTNVPPFYYHTNSGRCFMTQPYCNFHVYDYGVSDGRSCFENSDCESGFASFFIRNSKCINNKCTGDATPCSAQSDCRADEVCHAGYCTGPRNQCTDTLGGEFAGMNLIDMTIGRTAYHSVIQNPGWKKLVSEGLSSDAWKEWAQGFDCTKREAFTMLNDLLTPLLKDIPESIERLVDDKLVHEKEVLSTTFIEKIPLYVIVWSFEADSAKPTFGFLYSDLKKVYPSFLKKKKGKWYLKMKWKQLRKEDVALKRMYIVSSFGEQFSKGIIEYVMGTLSTEEREKLDRIINRYDLNDHLPGKK